MAVLGLPALRFLTTANQEERLVLLAVAKRAQKIVDTLQQNQAAHVLNLYAKAQRRRG
jgi:hypothetical protein